MEEIEKCEILRTLKIGEKVYVKGKIIHRPLPVDLLTEIREKTGTVKVFYVQAPPPSKKEVIPNPIPAVSIEEKKAEEEKKPSKLLIDTE